MQRLATVATLAPGALVAVAGRATGLLAGQRLSAAALHASIVQLDGKAASAEDEVQRKAMVNRMLYRARQRGFLELDLLIGMWAERELPRMSSDMVQDLEVVLDQENPYMFKWLTGQDEAPAAMQQNKAYVALQAQVKAMLDTHHSVPGAAQDGAAKEWVRGWTDTGTEMGPRPPTTGQAQ
ncbi:ankyrin repeat family [Micractinium conductrix]|uniref:Ankyrin repeat family n=1 Tax=Micractinium conductrix TaxID=554055 RepID=A0A2P6V3I6_9CHLO|nr:ankyrin repeat family [Micractinium conductrix]|eukprot:PSC68645.1 ankyrin repeat family [Micractinium conductrix]